MENYLKKICFFLLMLSGIFSAAAQRKLDSVQKIEEVKVIGKSFQRIIPIQKIERQQLEKLNTLSISDALRYFAGVQIKDYGGMGGLKTVNVRNMGTKHVGVFYDGLQVGNAQNGVVDLGKFSLDNIETIALYNGQKSDIFQAAKDFASASSIYMRSRKPRFKKGETQHLQIKYRVGSANLQNPAVRWERKLKNGTAHISSEYIKAEGNYKFRYKRLNLNGTIAYDTIARRHNSDIEAFRIEGGLNKVVADGTLNVQTYYYQSDRGLPGAIVKNVFYSGDRQQDKNFFVQTGFVKDVSTDYKIKIKGKFAFDYTHYAALDTINFLDDNVVQKMRFDNKYYQQDWYISAVNRYRLTDYCDVALSVDFEYNKLNAKRKGVGTKFTYPRRYSTLAALASSFDLGKIKMQASLLGTFVNDRVENTNKAPHKEEFSPAFFIGYEVTDTFVLRAFYKRIFRLPTFNDLYYDQIGYSSLKPEYTNQYNVGLTYEKPLKHQFLKHLLFQVDAYYLNITDKIIAAPTGTMFRWMMTNMGKVKNRGIDVTVALKTEYRKIGWNTNITYSYSKAQDFTKIKGEKMSSYGDQIPYTPWHSGSIASNISYKLWGLNYSFLYVGERYNGAVNNIPRNHIEPWYTHDIALQKKWLYRNYRIKASLEVNNLFNQYYDVVLNYPMPGRSYRFSISLEM